MTIIMMKAERIIQPSMLHHLFHHYKFNILSTKLKLQGFYADEAISLYLSPRKSQKISMILSRSGTNPKVSSFFVGIKNHVSSSKEQSVLVRPNVHHIDCKYRKIPNKCPPPDKRPPSFYQLPITKKKKKTVRFSLKARQNNSKKR